MTVKQLGYQLNLAIIIAEADDHAISHFVDYNSPQNGNCVNLTQSDGKCKKNLQRCFQVRLSVHFVLRYAGQLHSTRHIYHMYYMNYTDIITRCMETNRKLINKK